MSQSLELFARQLDSLTLAELERLYPEMMVMDQDRLAIAFITLQIKRLERCHTPESK